MSAPLSVRPEPSPGITIGEIERRLLEMKANWAPGVELRELGVLFAMLKVGQDIQKLQWFTKYETRFIINLREELRRNNKLFAGLSQSFVLSQCPDSEELIAIVTGARPYVPRATVPAPKAKPLTLVPAETPVTKTIEENPMPEVKSAAATNAEASAQSTKCPNCEKPYKHRGMCTGKNGKTAHAEKLGGPLRQADDLERPKPLTGAGTVRAQAVSQKVIRLAGGGSVILAVNANFLDLTEKDRGLVFGLSDLLRKYEEA